MFQLDTYFFHEQVGRVIESIVPQFQSVLKKIVYLYIAFSLLLVAEIFGFITFFTFLAESSVVALALAVIFLTIFSFLALRLYFVSRKPDEFLQIKLRFSRACRHLLDHEEKLPEHFVTIASAFCKFSSALEGKEGKIWQLPRLLKPLGPSLESFSFWFHRGDFLQMRELLLMGSVDEHVELVKCEPTSLEVHAALANAYVMLSGLYKHHPKKYRETAEKAIEELHILHDFAPNDPWIHVQLAYSYRDLEMPLEEIREYEEVLKLSPRDQEALYKLGRLYFQMGMNAKGLLVYERLKKGQAKKAESLIAYYGESAIS